MREEGGRTKEWWLPAYGLVAGVAPGGSVAGQERLLQGGGRRWWERLLDGWRRCWGPVPEAGQRRVRPAGCAVAAGRQRWRRLGTLAVALGREVDAGGAAGGGGRRGRGRGRRGDGEGGGRVRRGKRARPGTASTGAVVVGGGRARVR